MNNIFSLWRRHCIALLLLALSMPFALSAQTQRSKEFQKKYTLKEVVVLSRHNIRAPLAGKGSIVSQLTPHEWNKWTASTGELTMRGGVVETMMGQYFRKWLADEGLIAEGVTPTADDVYFYANSMQRTIATAQYFASGFMPTAGITIHHRFAPSKMDPIFRPQITKLSSEFEAEAQRQIADRWGGKYLKKAQKSLKESFETMQRTLDLQQSEGYTSGIMRTFSDDSCYVSFERGEEPIMHGRLLAATLLSDALTLQYYEQPDDHEAAFGHKLTFADWEKITKIKDTYQEILFSSPIVAANTAHPLLVYINDELHAKNRKFTFLCGHDSNIASVTAALGAEPYSLPDALEKQTPIGCKLVFEKWVDADGKCYVAINIMYPTIEQLRHLVPITLEHGPSIHPIHLQGISANADDLYQYSDIEARFTTALRAYDDIR